MLRTLTKLNKFSPVIKPEIQQLIINNCQKNEQRPVRQEALFSQFTDVIRFSGDGNIVDVSKIREKNKYDGEPVYVLSSLYNHALRITKYAPRNMFSLPLERSFGSFEYDREKLRNEKVTPFDELRNKYKSDIKNLNDPYQRCLQKDERYSNRIYLKKDDDYDFVRLEFVNKDADGNTILFHNDGFALSYEEEVRRRNLIKSIHIVEEKKPKQMDSMDFKNVLDISAPFGYSINRLDGIIIKNKFDGSNIYDMKEYDEVYGTGAFVDSLLSTFRLSIKGKGDVSIINQYTVDNIKKTALSITINNEQLAEKLTMDFINNTEHTNNDTYINMGKLMDLYNIDGHELLYVMYKTNGPNSLVTLADHLSRRVEADKFSIEDAKNLVNSGEGNYVDYLYGVPIKNSFRRNKGEEQNINIRKYNTRGGKFYECILWLMKYKLSNTSTSNTNPALSSRNLNDVDYTSIF